MDFISEHEKGWPWQLKRTSPGTENEFGYDQVKTLQLKIKLNTSAIKTQSIWK